jgi:superfamily II DNA or RNA helicase
MTAQVDLRDYQEEASLWLSKTSRGILVCPAGGGKTIIAAAAIAMVISSRKRDIKPRIYWLANTVEQVQQAQAALALFPEIAENAEITVGCAGGRMFPADADLLVVDECHHGPADTWDAIISAAPKARWGLTATPDHPDPDRRARFSELFGGNIFKVSRETLIEQGHLLSAEVRYLDDTDPGIGEAIEAESEAEIQRMRIKWPFLFSSESSIKEQSNRVRWRFAHEIGIVENVRRNAAAVSSAVRHVADSVLVLVNSVDHGRHLASQIPGAEVCHSGLTRNRRRLVIDLFREGQVPCLVATSLADEGLDVPRANVLILASAGRSATKLEQRAGRVLRPYPGQDKGLIYDFTDTGHPMLAAQSRARRRVFVKLGYRI